MSLSKHDLMGVAIYMAFLIIGISSAPYATSLLGLDSYVFQPNGLSIEAESIIGFVIFFCLIIAWLCLAAKIRAKKATVL